MHNIQGQAWKETKKEREWRRGGKKDRKDSKSRTGREDQNTGHMKTIGNGKWKKKREEKRDDTK